MADTGQAQAKGLAIVDQAGNGDTAEVNAVISPLAADQALTLPLAPRLVIGQGDFQGRFNSL